MDITQAVVLGLVQGATEYLPVDSTAHLMLVEHYLGWTEVPFVFDVLVQQGTLVGIFLYYWTDIFDIAKAFIEGIIKKDPFGTQKSRMGWYVILATIPGVFGGLLLKKYVEAAKGNPKVIFLFLLATAVGLLWAEVFGKRNKTEQDINAKNALIIGAAQALAPLPGVSRSGSTICAGMLLGFNRASAAQFSFLMSIPIMLAAGAKECFELFEATPVFTDLALPTIIGMIVSAISGYIVIRWFLGFLRNRSLLWFSAYCVLVSVIGLTYEYFIKH